MWSEKTFCREIGTETPPDPFGLSVLRLACLLRPWRTTRRLWLGRLQGLRGGGVRATESKGPYFGVKHNTDTWFISASLSLPGILYWPTTSVRCLTRPWQEDAGGLVK